MGRNVRKGRWKLGEEANEGRIWKALLRPNLGYRTRDPAFLEWYQRRKTAMGGPGRRETEMYVR
jgi:hypothetical protein